MSGATVNPNQRRLQATTGRDLPAAPSPVASQAAAAKASSLAPEHRDSIINLSVQGRLWTARPNGNLIRLNGGTAKELLDRGQPVLILTRLGGSYENSYSWNQEHFGSPCRSSSAAQSDSSEQTCVTYTASPISGWDSLSCVEPGGGIPGATELPPSGGWVITTSRVAREWSSREYRSWGLRRRETLSEVGGAFFEETY